MPADSYGWVERNRLHWCRTTSVTLVDALAKGLKLPHDCSLEQCKRHRCPELRHIGKPVPAKVHWEAGFAPLFRPDDVVKQKAKALFLFTREFFHITDHVREVSREAAERFFTDRQRFPPAAYERECLL